MFWFCFLENVLGATTYIYIQMYVYIYIEGLFYEIKDNYVIRDNYVILFGLHENS